MNNNIFNLILKIITMDNYQREKMGRKARRSSIKNFDIKKTASVLNTIYKSIINENYPA